MPIRCSSVILPCQGWEDFPSHLGDQPAAELLAAWTALWHPALLAATGSLPTWHSADEPPEPTTLDGELVVVPPPSRERMASDWCDRLRATSPLNPSPVESVASRSDTIAAVFGTANLDVASVNADWLADFLALGYTYMQVELLTRAMRYSQVLDLQQFESAVVAAAQVSRRRQ